MKNTFKKVFIGFMAFAMATGSFAQQRAHKKDNESYPKEWKQIARMEQDSFFLTDEARRIAENVLAFQRCTGGWPKNIDMARCMNDKELAKVIKDKSRRDDSTIDNNATTAQMIFLARLYRQTKDISGCFPPGSGIFAEWSIRKRRMAAILARSAWLSDTYYFQ